MTPPDQVLACQQAGWSVVPAAIERKRAMVPWLHWQTAAAGPELLAEWARRWSRCNWAVITGPLSGIVVVDIDPRHRGDHALAELEQRHGDLPWTTVVETPSGGWHIYLIHPGGHIPNSASRIGLGVDVRGDNGLALVPPSRRPDGAYRWAVGGPATVPPMPEGWVELLRPPPRLATCSTRRDSGADFPPHTSRRLAGVLAALQRAPVGQRNNTLFWCGCRLAEMVDQGAPAHWRQILADTAHQCGLEPAEIEDTLDSALGAER
jgi:Bifunctional DNA primase/polymerase, N-terminal